MSTFLQLCASLASESGAVGAPPTSVTGQTGRQGKCVGWIADAWRDIQTECPDANFLRKEFAGTLTAGAKRYTAAALGVTDWARWLTDTPEHQTTSIYPVGQQELESHIRFTSYERWKQSFDFGVHDQNRPTVYTVAPTGELCVGATPDASYTIRGEYQRSPQILAANGDVPILPERLHQIIVWRAAMMLAAHDEAWEAYKSASTRYAALLIDLHRECLPAITL